MHIVYAHTHAHQHIVSVGIYNVSVNSVSVAVIMGGAMRFGCNKLTLANNEILKTCFKASTAEDGKDICAHCSAYNVMRKNITKRLQHIAVCKTFHVKCNGEDLTVVSLKIFKDRAILACDGYYGNSRALAELSE